MPEQQTSSHLDYYASPGPLTSLGAHGDAFAALGGDVAQLARAVQLLLVHRAWAGAYQFTVTPDRQPEEGLRGAEAMLDCVLRMDPRPLTAVRMPPQRMVSNCRHFATLLVAMLRQAGVPARARCGFAGYFERGKWVDHWVAEYWRADEARWLLVDAQLDGLQTAIIKPDFDPLDVPRDRFLVAGAAWQRCRNGEADASTFGIADMWGLWYIGGNLVHDIASLNKIEPLPWDVWFTDEPNDAGLTRDRLELLDRVAPHSADAHELQAPDVRALYASEEKLRVPDHLLAKFLADDLAGTTSVNPLTER